MIQSKTEWLMKSYKEHEHFILGVLLSMVIVIVWSYAFNLLSFEAWKIPLGYQGDLWFGLAIERAFMIGDISPFFFKEVPTLNAPLVANWSDFPLTENFIYGGMGYLARLIGLFAAANFMLLLAYLLAGLSFWYTCLKLKYNLIFAFSGALVFAFCHFILARGLGHLVLTYCWHIPLLLLVTSWAFSKEMIPFKTRKFALAAAISVIGGIFNPYFMGMFLQFLGFAVLLHLVRKQYSIIIFPITLIVITCSAFLLMNADTLIYSVVNGENPLAIGRNLASLEVYGLKIPEMIYPPGYSPLSMFSEFAQRAYYQPAFVKGEMWSPYLGLIALTGFCLLIISSLYRLLQGKLQLISIQFWFVVWILIYSMIGGLNLVLGTWGFELFRATNRYSIFILVISLLFLTKFLSRNCPKVMIIPIACVMVVVGLGEEVGIHVWRHLTMPAALTNPIAVQVDSDRRFAQLVEKEAPNAMVFQLPVASFPEVGPINKMTDYEHFRPFLFTKTLHYSYGTDKGRGDTDWQLKLSKLAPSMMARKLESYGFGVIMINRKGFLDRGEFLIDRLLLDGKSIIAENEDLVAIKLQAALSPDVIDPWWSFNAGWSSDEGTHRWSESSHVNITFTSYNKNPKAYMLRFKLSGLTPRKVSVSFDGKVLDTIDVIPGSEVQFPTTRIILKPGRMALSFDTDASPMSPRNGDPRLLSFYISDFQFTPELSKTVGERSIND